jgi:hypothetical protein
MYLFLWIGNWTIGNLNWLLSWCIYGSHIGDYEEYGLLRRNITSLKTTWLFGGIYRLHLQGWSKTRTQRSACRFRLLVSCSFYFPALKVWVIGSSEMPDSLWTTRCYNTEDHILWILSSLSANIWTSIITFAGIPKSFLNDITFEIIFVPHTQFIHYPSGNVRRKPIRQYLFSTLPAILQASFQMSTSLLYLELLMMIAARNSAIRI